jgi:hypothetical protein
MFDRELVSGLHAVPESLVAHADGVRQGVQICVSAITRLGLALTVGWQSLSLLRLESASQFQTRVLTTTPR